MGRGIDAAGGLAEPPGGACSSRPRACGAGASIETQVTPGARPVVVLRPACHGRPRGRHLVTGVCARDVMHLPALRPQPVADVELLEEEEEALVEAVDRGKGMA